MVCDNNEAQMYSVRTCKQDYKTEHVDWDMKKSPLLFVTYVHSGKDWPTIAIAKQQEKQATNKYTDSSTQHVQFHVTINMCENDSNDVMKCYMQNKIHERSLFNTSNLGHQHCSFSMERLGLETV